MHDESVNTDDTQADAENARAQAGFTPASNASAWRQFWLLFLPLALLIGLSALLLARARTDSEITRIRSDEKHTVALGRTRLEYSMGVTFNHLLGLVREPRTREALEPAHQAGLAELQNAFATLLYRNARYQQVRWIDATGRERVRVDNRNGTPYVVPESLLQNKTDRYYVADALQLSPGEIYVSRMDLNIEHGQIELPYKPMVRVAIRLRPSETFDPGIIVINLSADHLIQALENTMGERNGTMLLNSWGYYLRSPDPEDEWGFMLGRDTTLAKRSPAVWRQISNRPTDFIELADGLWTWNTLSLQARDTALQAAESWIVVSRVAPETLADIRRQVWGPLLLIAALAILFSAIAVYRYVARLHAARLAMEALNRDLREKTELAERSSRAKSEFLSSMSHELRTPLNAILGFSQLMEFDENLSPDQMENMHAIRSAGQHLLTLIEEVLDLARIESGQLFLSMEPVEVTPVIDECLSLIASMAEKRALRITRTRLQPALVKADRLRLKQVLLNLLSNAVKYNREGGSIEIDSQIQTNTLRIRVSDTGRGIPAARLPELFEPFNRLGAETGTIEGTGIGLTITQRIVSLMGGAIGVESQLDIGSSFWIDLPLLQSVAEDAAAAADDAATGSQVGQPLSEPRHTVLCIEDNPLNIRLFEQSLGRRSHLRLIMAATPDLGMELAQLHLPDLILLDINLPGMDGYELMDAFQADPRLRTIPVIAVTANAMPSDIRRGRQAGFADYFTKPLDMQRFLEVVDQHLQSGLSKT